MASRRRRNKKRYRRRRSGGAGVVLTLLCILVIIAAIVAAITVFFRIRQVDVTGDSRYAGEEIVALSQIEAGDNIFFFNKFAAINRIFDQCPYLDEISIRRRLPDRVEIIVTECVPVAAIESGGSYYIVDIGGKLLEKSSLQAVQQYCVIQGAALDQPEVGKHAVFAVPEQENPLFLVLNTANNSDILQDIGEIDVSQTYDIEFTYTDRFTVKVGTADDLEQKIRYMKVVATEKLGPTETGIIDVSNTQTARFIPAA